ncbi:MAG TPA: hypothetical protein VLX32_02460 [Candidatus Acidoferrum sp.]|nr:hypothetical protein [Candidatus Acidoferrum sp.]
MSLGLQIFTLFHVLLSLAGILTGLVVVFGFLGAKQLPAWNAWFLITTIATSVTGFLFPFHKFMPSHVFGILSLILLSVAVFALYKRRLAGAWRRTYVISAMIALYLNVFILVVQLFEKVPALRALAPTQSEAPFKVAQLTVLVLFVLLTVASAIRFRELQPNAA